MKKKKKQIKTRASKRTTVSNSNHKNITNVKSLELITKYKV